MSAYDPLTPFDWNKSLTKCCCCSQRFWKSPHFSMDTTMEQKRMGINMMPCSSGTDMCDGCDAVISSTGIATISKLSLKDTEAHARL
mmetsp:Transcript_14196/g.17228  ORF Transcript_14196/g.17228 Transcript_14196/m.17228 type:complete len:87 (-) Transcript_14196:96-356(-)